MYIKFLTDVDDPRNGFKATVSLGKGEKKRIICLFCHTIHEFSILWRNDIYFLLGSTNSTFLSAKCGGTYRGTKGKISWSADDSRLQQSKNNCTWHIVAPQDYNIVLKVDALDMPFSGFGCHGSLKGLQVYSVDSVTKKGIIYELIIEFSNLQYIHYRSIH